MERGFDGGVAVVKIPNQGESDRMSSFAKESKNLCHQPFMAAIAAVHATLKALREGTPPGDLSAVAPADLVKAVTRDAEHQAWLKSFLSRE